MAVVVSKTKAREHFLLKDSRPSHVNLLSLVRDAACRLPGGVGTRPDVVQLFLESAYVSLSSLFFRGSV